MITRRKFIALSAAAVSLAACASASPASPATPTAAPTAVKPVFLDFYAPW